MDRVFGFEILPAPFVVAHLQLGLLLRNLGAPLDDATDERVGVYLTNALTGWEPPKEPKTRLLFEEMEQVREAAERVKRESPILVVLGNPPYDGFADIAVDEERDLTVAYKTTKRAPAPQGQGLNDLYIRLFRMAERRIVDRTGRGLVCYISNYSWLDKPSYTGMRERYLEAFDRIWIDCLNGDKFKSGKLTPDGQPDPSIFSTEWNRDGIQTGTAIALLVRKEAHTEAGSVRFRHLWGRDKREQLLASMDQDGVSLYTEHVPPVVLGLPFMPMESDARYEQWPRLPDLLPVFSPGVKTSRDLDLVSVDRAELEARMQSYFNPSVSDEEVKRIAPSLMREADGFNGRTTRAQLIRLGYGSGHVVPYCYQPFDTRFVYWHAETKLIDRRREELFSASRSGNIFLASRQTAERQDEGTPFYVTRSLPDWHMTRPGSMCFPITTDGFPRPAQTLFDLAEDTDKTSNPNLSAEAQDYLASLGIEMVDDATGSTLWMHALAIGYSPAYLAQNGDGIRQGWPRIPLPAGRDALLASADLGRRVAALLDTEARVPGVTVTPFRAELKGIGVVSRVGGGQLGADEDGLAINVGWGHRGRGGICMPGSGRLVERDYEPAELTSIRSWAETAGLTIEQALALLGERTTDVYLNDSAYWRNVPSRVWDYTIGGYFYSRR